MSLIERLRTLVDPNPFDSADERRRWQASWDVSDGPASAVHTFVWLERSRKSHALHEGIDQ